jgi:hypothetical protein
MSAAVNVSEMMRRNRLIRRRPGLVRLQARHPHFRCPTVSPNPSRWPGPLCVSLPCGGWLVGMCQPAPDLGSESLSADFVFVQCGQLRHINAQTFHRHIRVHHHIEQMAQPDRKVRTRVPDLLDLMP